MLEIPCVRTIGSREQKKRVWRGRLAKPSSFHNANGLWRKAELHERQRARAT